MDPSKVIVDAHFICFVQLQLDVCHREHLPKMARLDRVLAAEEASSDMPHDTFSNDLEVIICFSKVPVVFMMQLIMRSSRCRLVSHAPVMTSFIHW